MILLRGLLVGGLCLASVLFVAGLLLGTAALPALAQEGSAPPAEDSNGGSSEQQEEDGQQLGWSFAQGDVFYVRESQLQEQTQEFVGQEEHSTVVNTDYLRFEVTRLDREGRLATIELTFEATIMKVESEGDVLLEYDSRKPEHEDLAELPEIALVAARIGNTVRFRVDEEGRVTDMKGYGELFREWLEEMRELDPQEGVIDMYAALYSDEAFGRQIQSMFRLAPGRAVRPEETWSVENREPIPGLGTLEMDWQVTFDEMRERDNEEREEAHLSVDGSISLAPLEEGTEELFGADVEITLGDDEVEGEAQFEPAAGRLNQAMIDSAFSMQIEMGMGLNLNTHAKMRWYYERLEAETFQRALEGKDDDFSVPRFEDDEKEEDEEETPSPFEPDVE